MPQPSASAVAGKSTSCFLIVRRQIGDGLDAVLDQPRIHRLLAADADAMQVANTRRLLELVHVLIVGRGGNHQREVGPHGLAVEAHGLGRSGETVVRLVHHDADAEPFRAQFGYQVVQRQHELAAAANLARFLVRGRHRRPGGDKHVTALAAACLAVALQVAHAQADEGGFDRPPGLLDQSGEGREPEPDDARIAVPIRRRETLGDHARHQRLARTGRRFQQQAAVEGRRCRAAGVVARLAQLAFGVAENLQCVDHRFALIALGCRRAHAVRL
jgi:hypothetical protein